MARFEFRDDDGEETDYDSPSKEQWDNKPHSHFPADYYGEKEEGEIFEDESIDKMDESDDYEGHQITEDYKYNQEMDEGNNFRNTQFPGEEFTQRHDSRNSGRSFGSYFPWRSRRRTSEGSPSSEGSSFRAGSPRDCDNESHEDEFHNSERDIVNNNSSNSDHGEGNEEYRLVASTKYDRNYEMSDFFPRGIRSNNSHESSNSNSYRNPVSDDDEHDIPYSRSYSSDRNINEDRSNRTNNRSNGELVRSSTQQNSSSGAPEVHYHIYVSDRQASRWFDCTENDGRPQLSQEENFENESGVPKGKMLLWKKITLWAAITQLLLFLVGRYNLVSLSPPPSYLTWEEYRNHQFRLVKKVSKEGISLLNHITRTTVWSAFSTKEDESSNILPPRYAFPTEWESFVPRLGITTYEKKTGKTRKTTIFGQEEALEHLRMGLSLWSSPQKFDTTALQHQQPLIVYVSGGKGVGKDSLAYLLLEQLKSHDKKTDVPPLAEVCAEAFAANKNSAERDDFEVKKARELYCPLLHLTPSDYYNQNRPFSYFDEGYDGYDIESEDSFSPLYREILDHVIAAGGGASIVVLEKVDSPSLPSTWLGDLMAEVKSQQSIFGHTIFFLTSQIGTNTVEKWSRKRLQSIQGALDNSSAGVAGNAEIEALLRYELKSHHDVDSEGDGGGNVALGIENWLLIPMSPLDQNSMSLVLQSIANNVKASPSFGQGNDQSYNSAMSTRPSILLTELASQRILDALEWHQWIHKTTGELLRIWSPDGAPPLLDLWEEHVLEAIEDGSSCPRDTYSQKEKLILDFEGISTDRLWLRSCELVEKDGGRFDVTTNDGRRWKCLGESCSFFL